MTEVPPQRGFASEIREPEAAGSFRSGGSTEAGASYEATARVVDAGGTDDDRVVEAALRPRRLAEFPGQPRVRDQLGLVLEAARRRGSPPDHVLLSGPPGLGKTTLAMIVAAELDRPIRVTSGPAIQHAGDLAAVLSSLDEGEVLFLDEIHRMSRPAEEMLYLAMEDFRVDVIVGKGPGATAIPLELPAFTVVGATTRAGLLPAPLRDRFGFTGHLDYYDVADLVTILRRSARLLGRGRRRGGHQRDRRPLPRDAADRQPAAPAGARLGAGARRGPRRPRGRPRGAGVVRRRRRRARPARPGRARGAVRPIRWWPGGPVDAGDRRRGGGRHGRDGRRAIPRPRGVRRADAPWPVRRGPRVAPSRADGTEPRACSRTPCRWRPAPGQDTEPGTSGRFGR